MPYNNNNTNKPKNIYTIVDFPEPGKTYGKFTGTIPKNAASKSFSFLFNFMKNKHDLFGKFIVFIIKDIKTNKEYKYIGSRIKLHNPVVVNKKGKDIIYKYKNVVGVYSNDLQKIKYIQQ